MSVPTAYATAAQARLVRLWHWVEIEGLPWAYGNFSAGPSLFSGRPVGNRYDGVKPFSVRVPSGFDQRVEILDGRASIGQLRIELLDKDGTLASDLGLAVARRDNLLTPAAEIAADAVQFESNEIPDTDVYPLGGGHIFIGRETITYLIRNGKIFTGLMRGRYGSTPQAHGTGSPISRYPRFLGMRRATVRYFLGENPPSSAADDAASAVRMIGIVTGCVQSRGSTCYDLTIDSIDRSLAGWVGVARKRLLFSDRWRTTLTFGMPDGNGFFEPEGEDDIPTGGPWEMRVPAEASVRLINSKGTLAKWNAAHGRGHSIFVRIDDEIMIVSEGIFGIGNNLGIFVALHRGLFGTPVQQHHTGAEVQEVMPIAWSPGAADDPVLKFLPWTSDHPIDIALQLITSTGTGLNGPYDTLPASWGMGVPVDFIDVDGIERTRRFELPGVRVAGIQLEEFDLREWLSREIYQVFGLFPVTMLGGKYSIRRLAPPMPLDSTVQLSHRHLVTPPEWDSNVASAIGQVTYRFDHDPGSGEFRSENQVHFMEAQALYAGAFGAVERSSILLRSGAPGIVPHFAHLAGGAHEFVADQIGWWQTWWERPPPVIDLRCTWEQHLLEPGDIVALSSDVLPDTETGKLGLTSKPAVVVSKRPNDQAGYVDLQLLQMGLASSQLRHIPPSILVTTWDPVSRQIGFDPTTFALPGDSDAAYFAVGYLVRVCSPDLSIQSAPVALQAVAPSNITLAATPSRTPQPGDVVRFAPYAAATLQQVARYCYRADSNRLLGGADPAHELRP